MSLNKKRKSMNRRQMRSKRVANGKRKSMNRIQMRSKRKSMCGGNNNSKTNNSKTNNNNELGTSTGTQIQSQNTFIPNIFLKSKKKIENQ